MPTRNVSLTKELDQFIAAKVEAGLYANASEVMRTALRVLERDEREYEEKLAALRAAIDKGLASGVAEPGVFSRIRNTTRTWGWRQTDQYLAKLEDGFDLLAQSPLIGRSCDWIRPGLRRFEIGKHVVFYIPDSGEVRIVRVLHQQMVPARSHFEQ